MLFLAAIGSAALCDLVGGFLFGGTPVIVKVSSTLWDSATFGSPAYAGGKGDGGYGGDNDNGDDGGDRGDKGKGKDRGDKGDDGDGGYGGGKDDDGPQCEPDKPDKPEPPKSTPPERSREPKAEHDCDSYRYLAEKQKPKRCRRPVTEEKPKKVYVSPSPKKKAKAKLASCPKPKVIVKEKIVTVPAPLPEEFLCPSDLIPDGFKLLKDGMNICVVDGKGGKECHAFTFLQ